MSVTNKQTFVSSCDTLLRVIRETRLVVIAYCLHTGLEFTTFVITAIIETGVMILCENQGPETLDDLPIAIYQAKGAKLKSSHWLLISIQVIFFHYALSQRNVVPAG